MRFGIFLFLSMFWLLSCGGSTTKPANRNASVLSGNETVYGDSSSSDIPNESTESVTDDPNYSAYADAEVSSEDLRLGEAVENPADAAGFDWQPIYFNFDESKLTEESLSRLRRYAEELKRRPEVTVLLEGHADSRGTENYNLALGERRAQAVKRFFLGLGITETQMRTVSYGELRPESPQEDEYGWARNRRVAFTF